MDINIRELDVDMIAPSREKMHLSEQGGSKIVIIGKPGCFAKGTMIKLWGDRNDMAIEKLRKGELLVGDDLKPRRVLDICFGREMMHAIIYGPENDPNKSVVVVNDGHILTLYSTKDEKLVDIYLRDFLVLTPLEQQSYFWVLQNKKQRTRVPFVIRCLNEEDDYYGVEIDENQRFLLADGSIVHNTGKTTLITSLMYEKSDIFPVGIIMSGTEDSNGHFRKIVPSTFVYNQLDTSKIESFVMRQKIAKKHLRNPWGMLLLDDCTDDPKIFNTRLFHHIFKNGRHWKMLFILSLQYCMDVRPVIRNSIDGTFILRESSLRNRKVLWENYASIIPDFRTFCSIMDSVTEDWTSLYIHNQANTNNWKDCVFWYKAKPIPPGFKFGAKDTWKFHNQRYDPAYKDPFLV